MATSQEQHMAKHGNKTRIKHGNKTRTKHGIRQQQQHWMVVGVTLETQRSSPPLTTSIMASLCSIFGFGRVENLGQSFRVIAFVLLRLCHWVYFSDFKGGNEKMAQKNTMTPM